MGVSGTRTASVKYLRIFNPDYCLLFYNVREKSREKEDMAKSLVH